MELREPIQDLTILIVDDDNLLIEQLKELILYDPDLKLDKLIRSHLSILTARNGAEALSLLKERNNINLILLDILMPIMDGYEICKILRRNPEFSHCANTPIFFISGTIKDTQEQLHGLELEADEVFAKPFDPLLLGSYIKKELKRQILAWQHDLNLESSRLLKQVQERAQRQNTFHFVSSHTYSHSARVEVISSLLASSPVLALNELESLSLQEMVRDHDKGKIGIPEEILNKPKVLSERELSIIQMHSAISCFLMNAENLAPFDVAVYGELFHHEKYLGGGYPSGRPLIFEDPYQPEAEGPSIRLNLLLSIVSCADALDALTSKRPYKEASTLINACEVLITHSFSHFDPIVIEALFERLAYIDEADLKRLDLSATKKTAEQFYFFKEVYHHLNQSELKKRLIAFFCQDLKIPSFIQPYRKERLFWLREIFQPTAQDIATLKLKNANGRELAKELAQRFKLAKKPLAEIQDACPFLYALVFLELGCSYRFLSFAEVEELKEEVLKLIPLIDKEKDPLQGLAKLYNLCLVLFLLKTLYYIEYLDLNNAEHAEYLLHEFNILYELWKRLRREAAGILKTDRLPLTIVMYDLYEKMMAATTGNSTIRAVSEKINSMLNSISKTWEELSGS